MPFDLLPFLSTEIYMCDLFIRCLIRSSYPCLVLVSLLSIPPLLLKVNLFDSNFLFRSYARYTYVIRPLHLLSVFVHSFDYTPYLLISLLSYGHKNLNHQQSICIHAKLHLETWNQSTDLAWLSFFNTYLFIFGSFWRRLSLTGDQAKSEWRHTPVQFA